MKKIVMGVILLVVLFGMGICFAEPGIPNLVGTWTVQADGAVLFKGNNPEAVSMHGGEAADFKTDGSIKHVSRESKMVVTAQKGRVLHGTFTSAKATENVIMIIGPDNKTIYAADHDGFLDGNIVNKNKINLIYRHVGPNDTAVFMLTWTRKK